MQDEDVRVSRSVLIRVVGGRPPHLGGVASAKGKACLSTTGDNGDTGGKGTQKRVGTS